MQTRQRYRRDGQTDRQTAFQFYVVEDITHPTKIWPIVLHFQILDHCFTLIKDLTDQSYMWPPIHIASS